MAADLSLRNTANLSLKANESKFIKTLETRQEDVVELSKTVALKQVAINRYIDSWEATKKELATVKCEYDTMNMKFTSYKSSQYVVDHILPHFNNKSNGSDGSTRIGYNACPSTVRFDTHNLDMYPVETEITRFKVTTPIVSDPTTIVPKPVDSSVPESVDTFTVSEDSDSDDKGTELTKQVMY